MKLSSLHTIAGHNFVDGLMSHTEPHNVVSVKCSARPICALGPSANRTEGPEEMKTKTTHLFVWFGLIHYSAFLAAKAK